MNKFMIKKGFTIIELIVVVAILGILVLLAGPRLLGYVKKAELRRIQHDVKVMEQEIGTVFISKDDDFNKWGDNSKDLNQLIEENKLFEKEGVAKDVEPTDGPYKVIPEKYKDKINTKLKGTFYANSGGKVYYEHEKPLVGIPPSEPEKEPVYSDEEIQDLIDNGFIPVANAEELNQIRVFAYTNGIPEYEELTWGAGTQWEDKYTGKMDSNYVQVAHIDLSEYSEEEGWAPIGNNDSRFRGSFDGNGYSITGLKINRPETDYVGLFGYTSKATIENIALEDIDITGGERTGGLVGYATTSSKITNSHATGSVTGTGSYTGGLVGQAGLGTKGSTSSSTITNSYATGSVTGEGNWTGGLVGYLYGSISNSYATGSVEGKGDRVGGLAGYAYTSSKITNSYATGSVSGASYIGGLLGIVSDSTIENSHATGSVTGTGSFTGGLVGYAQSSSPLLTKINNSYATGSVTGGNSTGGLVGHISAFRNQPTEINNSYATGSVEGTGNYTGGLVGYAKNLTVTKSYATGSVEGTRYVGGLVGDAVSETRITTITNSYATGSVTGGNYVGGLVGRTASGYNSSTETKITNSYATGSVTGTSQVGGLVGQAHIVGEITNSYWDKDTTGRTNSSGGGEGKTTSQMKKRDTYDGWDFENTWQINEGQSYPTLR